MLMTINRNTNVGEIGHMNENETVLETVNEGVKKTIVIPDNNSLAYNEAFVCHSKYSETDEVACGRSSE
jgi:hypothetical protein